MPELTSPVSIRTLSVLLRGWRIPHAAVIILAVALVGVFVPDIITLPSLIPLVTSLAPSAAVAAGVVTVGVLLTTSEPTDQLPDTAPRRLIAWRAARVLALTALAVAAFAIPWPTLWLASLSAITSLVGEGLILARFAGPAAAWTLPVLHLTAASLFGYTPTTSEPLPWAWILTVDPGAPSLLLSAAILAAGVVLWAPAPAQPA